jgi:hypothetical protein
VSALPTRATKRISVWSGPRNVSTALMYSFRQRRDTMVVDEPLYGYYLETTNAPHPGREEILPHLETDAARVIHETLLGTYTKPVVMFKNMAHHLVGLDRAFLGELTNVLLTRDPLEMLPSLVVHLPEPTLSDTGFTEQVEILESALEAGDTPVVIEARRLVQDPEGVLRKLCSHVGISFDPAMLAWPEGPKREDGVWAKYWYDNVHASTGFVPYSPKAAPFPERLEPLLAESQPYYEKLTRYAL